MYYEDKWDGDELVYRGHPQGEWKPVPRAELLRKIKNLALDLTKARKALDRT